MIVKNESGRISRCLDSVKNFVDYWVIGDTGSKDSTVDEISFLMADIPGRLLHLEWSDFSTARNQVLEAATPVADYCLIIDADEILVAGDRKTFGRLIHDAYKIKCDLDGVEYWRRQLISTRKDWVFVGKLHESLVCSEPYSEEYLDGIINIPMQDSPRNQNPNKYLDDLPILEEMFACEPENSRNKFLLSKGYQDAGNDRLAYQGYLEFIAMHGDRDLTWYSMYQLGLLSEKLQLDTETIVGYYQRAFELDPFRSEPVIRLIGFFLSVDDSKTARALFDLIDDLPYPQYGLFVERSIYLTEIPRLRKFLG